MRPTTRGTIRTAVATAAWGLAHTALADERVKRLAERSVGPRLRNAWYRPAYNAFSVLSLAALAVFVLRQPSRALYRVRGGGAVAMRAGQVMSFGFLVATAWEAGPAKFLGLPGVFAWLTRSHAVPPEPPGQGPVLNAAGEIHSAGPFKVSRQAANVGLIPLLVLNPKMTTRSAAFCFTGAAYCLFGAWHSDRALAKAFGRPYREYRHRVGWFGPKGRSTGRRFEQPSDG